MSNPTTLVENFNGSLGAFTGVDPIRYDGGLWLEEGTTNLFENPISENTDDAWGLYVGGAGSRVTSEHLFGTASIQFISANSAVDERVQPSLSNASVSPRTFTSSVYAKAASGTPTIQHQLIYVYTSGLSSDQVSTALSTEWQRMPAVTLAMDDSKTMLIIYASIGTGAIQQQVTIYATGLQMEEKSHATSLAVGSFGAGYSWTGTPHASASTRDASSASVTIAEPAAVACWYREQGVKTFAYLETLGALGNDGDISYAGGDLTISTTRSLVIGPFAAFDRTLTDAEQANLSSTQNWSLTTVLGGGNRRIRQQFQLRPY